MSGFAEPLCPSCLRPLYSSGKFIKVCQQKCSKLGTGPYICDIRIIEFVDVVPEKSHLMHQSDQSGRQRVFIRQSFDFFVEGARQIRPKVFQRTIQRGSIVPSSAEPSSVSTIGLPFTKGTRHRLRQVRNLTWSRARGENRLDLELIENGISISTKEVLPRETGSGFHETAVNYQSCPATVAGGENANFVTSVIIGPSRSSADVIRPANSAVYGEFRHG